jgi:hypothetical protein
MNISWNLPSTGNDTGNDSRCWCRVDRCIHSQLSTIADSCQTNYAMPPSLEGLDVRGLDPFKNGLLHLAAIRAATFPVFDALVRADADISAINAIGETFMHVLDPSTLLEEPYESGHLHLTTFPIFDTLARAEADNHAANAVREMFGETIMHAVNYPPPLGLPYERKGYLSRLFELLKQRGFSFHARDHSGKTILLMLLQERGFHRHPVVLEAFTTYLLNEKDLWRTCHLKDNFGLSAATYLSELIKNTEVEIRNTNGITVLNRVLLSYKMLRDHCNQPWALHGPAPIECEQLSPGRFELGTRFISKLNVNYEGPLTLRQLA